MNKNLALALEFSILHLALSCTILTVSGMCDIVSYFLHVLLFPWFSLSLTEVDITELGLVTARMYRKRITVLNYSIISCLYIKKGPACRKNVSLVWTNILTYSVSFFFFVPFMLQVWNREISKKWKALKLKEKEAVTTSSCLANSIRIPFVSFLLYRMLTVHVFSTYFTGGVSSVKSCKM